MKKHLKSTITFIFCCIYILTAFSLQAQALNNDPELDKKVSAFLKSHSGTWADMNVPKIDGQLLYDIILKNNYKSALEIGTSTGHSSIWIAWAFCPEWWPDSLPADSIDEVASGLKCRQRFVGIPPGGASIYNLGVIKRRLIALATACDRLLTASFSTAFCR